MTCDQKNNYWAHPLIGKPYHPGQSGPDQFDCWGLVRYIYQQQLHHTLPAIPIDPKNLKAVAVAFRDHPERKRWFEIHSQRESTTPQEYDVLLMRQSRHPIHVGIWLEIDGGGVLHAIDRHGVVFQKIDDLQHNGWQIAGYYRLAMNSEQ